MLQISSGDGLYMCRGFELQRNLVFLKLYPLLWQKLNPGIQVEVWEEAEKLELYGEVWKVRCMWPFNIHLYVYVH